MWPWAIQASRPELMSVAPLRLDKLRSMELDRIAARLAAISTPPWRRHGADVHTDDRGLILRGRDGTSPIRAQADYDAEFVAHAPDDIRELLAEVVRLR